MKRNEDYRKGMSLLLHKCKVSNINIRRLYWVCDFSMLLSKHNACYKFWFNVDKQLRMYRIPHCRTVYDIMYGPGRALFTWDKTEEGSSFWYNMFSNVLFPYNGSNIDLDDLRRFNDDYER